MHGDPTFGIVVLTMGLLFAASVVSIGARRIRFPYTIALVIIGLLMGWAARSMPALGALSALRLTPEVALFVFLPALLFESSFNLDARSLVKNLLPVSMLAVPGLLISTALVGLMVHLGLALPLGVALLFGALISATDPVAVVALFREMGAPKRLGLLVEGESLFNDGTALVVFNIILGAVLAGSLSAQAVAKGALDFLVVVAGGVATGVAFGWFFAKMIEMVENDRLVEITLTTILAHSTFLAADHLLHVSGVIATVSAGLTMGSYGRSKISPPVLEHMESFWEYFAFVCNSLIFLLVGLSIDLGLFVENFDAVVIAAVAVIAARAVGVFGLFPLVGRLGSIEKVGRGFQTVIFWGGLRGALAIVMALSIPESLPQRDFLLALTLGVVLFSLLVNGLTTKRLMSLLGLDRYSLKERFERAQAVLVAKGRASAGLEELEQGDDFGRAIARAEARGYRLQIEDARKELGGLRDALGAEDETEVLLRHLLLFECKRYISLFNSGALAEGNMKEMMISIDRQMDRIKEGRGAYLAGRPTGLGRTLGYIERLPLLGLPARRRKAAKIASGYEMERARHLAGAEVLEELKDIEARGAAGEAAIRTARELYLKLHEKAARRLEDIRGQYPEYVEKVESSIVKRRCLAVELEAYQELYRKGAISDKVLGEMRERIGAALRRHRPKPVQELVFNPSRLVRMVPYFSELDGAELSRLVPKMQARSFLRAEEIVRYGEKGDSLFIIGRGEVEVFGGSGNFLARLGPGDFFGETALLHPQPRTATVRAVTPCVTLELTRRCLMPVLEHAPDLASTLEEAYRKRVLSTMLSGVPLFEGMDAGARDGMAERMRYARYTAGEVVAGEGLPGGTLYVIRDGEAEVTRAGQRVAVLGPGQCFGQECFKDGGNLSATLRAVGDLEIYSLDRQDAPAP